MTICKTQIQYKELSHGRKVGSVPCLHNKGKQCPDVSCKLNCDRFISKDDIWLRCGGKGSNILSREGCHSLRQMLEGHGEYAYGSLAGTQGED